MIIELLLGAGLAIVALLATRWKSRAHKLGQLLDNTTQKLEQLQVDFERFAPPDVVESLAGSGRYTKPEHKQVTVLFADLVGFTSMCDKLEPDVTVEILNGYFQRMSQAVSYHQGRVTELIGDGILALFGALDHNPWQVQDAVKCGLAMRERLVGYNEELRARSYPELQLGIGIHKGAVLAGIMGNHEISKFGVVGDTINVAARVEALTRQLGVDLLITDEIRSQLDVRFQLQEMQPMPVKGKPHPIATYFVKSFEETKR